MSTICQYIGQYILYIWFSPKARLEGRFPAGRFCSNHPLCLAPFHDQNGTHDRRMGSSMLNLRDGSICTDRKAVSKQHEAHDSGKHGHVPTNGIQERSASQCGVKWNDFQPSILALNQFSKDPITQAIGKEEEPKRHTATQPPAPATVPRGGDNSEIRDRCRAAAGAPREMQHIITKANESGFNT